MPFLDEITKKKEALLQTFLCDQKLVDMISGQDDTPLPALDLRYNQVFPYAWLNETIDEAKTFVCFEVDIPSIETIAVKNCYLYVWVFTHEKLMRTKEGVLVDRIVNRVDELLNGRTEYGFGRLKLESCLRIAPNVDYYGRVLKYFVQDWNRFGEKL